MDSLLPTKLYTVILDKNAFARYVLEQRFVLLNFIYFCVVLLIVTILID